MLTWRLIQRSGSICNPLKVRVLPLSYEYGGVWEFAIVALNKKLKLKSDKIDICQRFSWLECCCRVSAIMETCLIWVLLGFASSRC